MSDIYDEHRATFGKVQAYVILRNGDCVATVSLKFPSGNSTRLHAFVHWYGTRMVRGYAGGYGYDKASAACSSAAEQIVPNLDNGQAEFIAAMKKDGPNHWTSNLRDAGFTVFQAV